MGKIDLYESSALVIQSQYNSIEGSKDLIQVGKGYSTAIRFDLTKITGLTRVISAELVLFKVPIKPSGDNCLEWNYTIAPLLDYVNIYGSYYTPPKIGEEWQKEFEDVEDKSFITIVITDIMNQWIIGGLDNKGLLLDGNNCSNLLSFASPEYDIAAMRPFMRITYENPEGEVPPTHPDIIFLPSSIKILRS